MSNPREEDLVRLGARLAAHNGSVRRPLDVASLVVQTSPVKRSRVRARLTRFAGALAVAAMVALVVDLTRAAAPIGFVVDGVATQVGEPIEATTTERAISFSDGSSLLSSTETSLAVTATSPLGATVVLQRGRLVASIRHRDETRWQVLAGPYDIAVTGTRFDAAWTTQDGLTLVVHDGSVRVHGPGLEPRTLVAGQSLRVPAQRPPGHDSPAPEASAAAAPSPSPPTDPAPAPSPALQPPSEAAPPLAVPPALPAPGRRAGAARRDLVPDWETFEAQGHFEKSFAAAEAVGFERLVERLPAESLVRLGDVARYSGHAARARLCYQRARSRFAGSSSAARAAFELGLLTEGADAARWFATYLEEAPQGVLEREALGRLLELRFASGDAAAATRLAQRYLERFPSGPHAALAREVLRPR